MASRNRSSKSKNPVAAAAEQAIASVEHDRLPKGAARQVGSTLSRGPGQLAQFLVPPDYRRLADYERAFKTDETVGAGIEFMKLALIASIKEYRHPDKQIQTFVRKSLDEMIGTVEHTIGELVESSLVFGYSVSEILWRLSDGKVMIEELINYHPASLTIVPNINGRLIDRQPITNPFYTPPAGISHTGIWQLGIDGATYEHLPLNKICLTTHLKRSGLYTGTSAIQRIYKNWMLKDIVLEMYNVALDRYGTPIAYAIVPAGVTPDLIQDPNTGKTRNMTIREAAEQAMSQMHRGTALVFQRPSMQDDIKIDTLTTGNNFGTVFLDAINYYNQAIFRGLLIPKLLLEEGSAGLSNPGQTHWNVFKLMIQALAKEIVKPFEEQVIGQMIRLNFRNSDPGGFVIEPFDPAVSAVLASVFEQMVKTGYLNPADEDDLNEVRAMFGLPTKNAAPVLTETDHRKILTATADKVANDKIKAQAAMVKAKSSETQVAHSTTRAFDHTKALSDRDHEHRAAELEHRRSELAMKRAELKHKREIDAQKTQQDHEMKLMTAKHQHAQNMAAINKGLVAQPIPTAQKTPSAPKVSPKPKPKA